MPEKRFRAARRFTPRGDIRAGALLVVLQVGLMGAERARREQWLGHYKLVRRLATGGMAEVYEARRVGPGGFSKRVAVKRVLPQLANDPRLLSMFCDEARIHAGLSHPNLVQVVDFGESHGELFMAMEYVDGINCAELLAAVESRARGVDLAPALFIAREVLRGLAYAHAARDEYGQPLGLIHRDVAPGNILVSRSGQVKLADFGVMRGRTIEARTAPGEIKGKIGYVSPEQALGRSVDARSDLFSLGVVLAELLLGVPLFPGNTELEILENLHKGNLQTLRDHAGDIPGDVLQLLLRALEDSPAQRFACAQDFIAAVESAMAAHDAALSQAGLSEWLAELGVLPLQSSVHDIPEPRQSSGQPSEDNPYGTRIAGAVPQPISRPGIPGVRKAVQPQPPRFKLPAADSGEDPGYRMRRPGGTIVGPLSLARLLEMIATARVGLDTLVSNDGGPFVPVASVEELARLASRPAYRFFGSLEGRRSQRMSIDRARLPSLLASLVLHRRSGLLLATSGREQKRIYFVDGSPLFTASTDHDELLGWRLVADGLMDRQALERVLERGYRAGRRLGESLIAAGVLKPSGLLKAVAAQRIARITALCRWTGGELSFVEGARCEEEAVSAPGSPLKLVASAILAAYSDDEVAALLEPLRAEPLQRRHAAARLGVMLDLPVPEARALALAGGDAPLDALIHDAALAGVGDAAQVRRAVFIGLAVGALVRHGQHGAPG